MLAWNTDWCCVYIDIGGTGLLVSEAERQGKIVVSTELGGGGHVTAEIHRLASTGLANVLRHVGALEGEVVARESPPTLLMATELDNYLLAPESGLFETLVDLGQRVEAGEPVGRMHFLERRRPGAGDHPREDRRHRLRRPGGRHDRAGRQRHRRRPRGRSRGARLMQRCTVAATQVDVRHLDVEHNLETHLRLIAETAEAGCDLVVFPETSVTGNNGSPEVTRFAESHDGRIFRTIHGQAKESGIVVSYGFCELYRGTHYNTSALVGPDGLIGLQRKVHASFDEFFRFRQAYEWGVYDLGFCTVGTAICHDSDFFESWRILALKGAEVILLPHANRTMPAGGGILTFDGRERELTDEDDRCARRRSCSRRGRARRGSTTSSPGTTASTPSSRTWSGSTGTAPTSAAPTSSRPTARCSRTPSPAPATSGSPSSSTPSSSSRRARTRGSRSRSGGPRRTHELVVPTVRKDRP